MTPDRTDYHANPAFERARASQLEDPMPEVTKLYPVFAVRDLPEAISYYCEKLGFTVRWTWGEPPARVGVSLNQVEIQLDAARMGAPPGP